MLHAFIPPFASARPRPSLQNRTAVVTGATRGIGRGLAIGLGEAGAHVIITGRTARGRFSLSSTADAINDAGGSCEAFTVDHADDAAVRHFFDSLRNRQIRLDLFVNNAYAGVGFIADSMSIPFWEKSADNPATADPNSDPGRVWDAVNGVGLRNNYICCVYATRLMREQGGLIVNISSWAGLGSLFDAAYSVGKAAVDRLSAEIAAAAPDGVHCFTLCPGYVGTEIMKDAKFIVPETELPDWNCETPLFVGRVLAALAGDDDLHSSMNGKVVVAAEAGELYRIKDEAGFRSVSFRSFRFTLLSALPFLQNSSMKHLIPRRLNVPWWLVRWVGGAVKYWR